MLIVQYVIILIVLRFLIRVLVSDNRAVFK